MSLTTLITVAVVLAVYLTGVMRPTGLLSRAQPKLTGSARRRAALIGIPIVVALGIFWTFGYNGIWKRLQIDLEGTITDRQDFPQTSETHGPTTVYKVQRSDGSLGQYTATRTDPSLPQTMPVGSRVAKHRWELSYILNGQRVDDIPVVAYSILMAIGLSSLIAAGVLLVRNQKRAASGARG